MFKVICVIALAALCSVAVAADAAAERNSDVPVLLELFTSEGCSSCPPADRLLETLDAKQPVPGALLVVLSEHVDYWNHLGWRDPFSSPQFSERQQEYTNRYRLDGVYTPQLVVDGRYGFVGSDGRQASAAILNAMRDPKIPITIASVMRSGNSIKARIELPASPGFHGLRPMLYVALADSRRESSVARGENGGRTLAHVAVTRVLKQVGAIDLERGSAKEITLPVEAGNDRPMRLITFIQDVKSGHVLAVAQQNL